MATQCKSIELPWGGDMLRVPIPASWRILGIFAPPRITPKADARTLCQAAQAHPIGAAPLASRDLRGKKVLIIADDRSRPTPVARFFGPVREALVQAGAEVGSIEVLFALGAHRPMTQEEAQAKIGAENLAAHRWHNHNCFDPGQMVRLGTTARGTPVLINRMLTQFDLIVTLGVIEPHVLYGFSGGLKMIMPGCAGEDTIGRNHLLGITGDGFNYVGAAPDTSPMRLDMEEAAGMLAKEIFIVNVALDSETEIVGFFCGCPRQAFRAGMEFVRSYTELSIPEPTDIVITNSHPFDADLRQGLKCVGNTLEAARPGGIILGFLNCQQGVGDMPFPAWTLPYSVLRTLLRMVGPKCILSLSQWIRHRERVEEQFLDHFGLRMAHRNQLWFYSDHLDPGTGKKLGALRQYASIDRMLAAARRRAGPRATVAVFPFGGATYTRAERQ